MAKIGVIGCGAWATTISSILLNNGHQVIMWVHQSEFADAINNAKENTYAMPGLKLGANIWATTELPALFEVPEYLIFGIASPYVKLAETIAEFYKGQPMLSLTKGLVDSKKTLFISKYLQETIPNLKLGVLSGPNIAAEIADQKPAASVIASTDDTVTKAFQDLLNIQYFRLYSSDDVVGVELGGVLKNIIALAGGMADGLSLGNNAKAALMSRGLKEMMRFGVHFGAKESTFYGLSGLGDLVTTCSSDKSRNWNAGFNLIQRPSATGTNDINKPVVEGIRTTQIVYRIAKDHDIDMPITQEVYQVLFDDKNPHEALYSLMARELKPEI